MHPGVRCRGGILKFLADTACATSFNAAHGDMYPYEKERETDEFKEQLALEMDWARANRAAIWRGLDEYLNLLADFDKRLRIAAPYTLGLLALHADAEMPDSLRRREPYEAIVRALETQLEEEPSELVQASIVFGLGFVAARSAKAKLNLHRRRWRRR